MTHVVDRDRAALTEDVENPRDEGFLSQQSGGLLRETTAEPFELGRAADICGPIETALLERL